MNISCRRVITYLAIYICWFFATLIWSIPLVNAQEIQEITAYGVGVVIQGDQAIARDRAVDDALRKVIVAAVGTLVEPETRIRNYQTLSDDIYSRSSGYVQSYQILDETSAEDIIKITIKAVVSRINLSDDLQAVGIHLKYQDRPRVMVIIEEKNSALSEDVPLHQTEDILIRMLTEKGFSFVDRQIVRQQLENEDSKLTPDGDIAALASLGRREGAEVVIIGKTLVEKTETSISKLGPMGSYRASVSIRAVKSDSHALLALANASAVSVHINPLSGGAEAVKKAALEASDNLIDDLIDRLDKEVGGILTVQLVITGINDRLLVVLKNDLKSRVRGVQYIHQRFFGAGVAKLDVDIKGTSQMLADELTRKKFSNYTLSMSSYSPDRIELQLFPDGSLP